MIPHPLTVLTVVELEHAYTCPHCKGAAIITLDTGQQMDLTIFHTNNCHWYGGRHGPHITSATHIRETPEQE